MLEKVMIFHIEMENMHSSKSKQKSYNWRNKKWFSSIDYFGPWDTHSRLIEPIHSEWHSEYWTNECMRAWSRNSKIPSSKIPDNCSKKEREHYTNSKWYWLISNHIKRKEMNDPHSYRYTTETHSQEIKKSSKQYSLFWCERICIDNWCYSICCIMKTIDEFKCTNKKETEDKKNIDFHKKR